MSVIKGTLQNPSRYPSVTLPPLNVDRCRSISGSLRSFGKFQSKFGLDPFITKGSEVVILRSFVPVK